MATVYPILANTYWVKTPAVCDLNTTSSTITTKITTKFKSLFGS